MAVQGREASDQEDASNSFYLAKCILRSSVVLQAVYGHIRSPATLDIVFGKETSLELVVLSEDGVVQSICEQPVFGKIRDLKVLPWNERQRSVQPQTHGKDLLVITSDSGKMSFLTFCVELHRFLAVAHVQISQPGNARRELGQFLAVESRGRAIAVSALEDKIAIYPTSIAAGTNIVEKRMIYPRESWEKGGHITLGGTVWSLAFVSGSADSKLEDVTEVVLVVILHRKGGNQNELLILVCDTMVRSIGLNRYSPSSPTYPLAYSVIDVPDMPGFVLLFRADEILLLEISSTGNLCVMSSVLVPEASSSSSLDEKTGYGGGDEEGSCNEAVSALLELVSRAEDTIDDPFGERKESVPSKGIKGGDLDGAESPVICAWTWSMDASFGSSLMFCVDTGEIFLLQLRQNYLDEIQMSLSDCLYRSPPLRCLLWMNDGFIAALTEMGDGQVLNFKDGTIFHRSIIENISPILDFSLVDYHNEKQDQMFACAGAGQEGSLRVIRNGVSVEKLISTGPMYEGVTGSWTMKFCRGEAFHAFLVLSFVEETRVLSVGLSFNDITDSVGFNCSACTLACGWIEDGWVSQVCSNEVRVCAPTMAAHPKGLNSLLPLSTCWVPGKSNISLGAVSHRRVILAMSQPGLLLMLGLRVNASGSQELVELQQCIFEAELSCISIPQEEEPFPIPLPPAIVGLLESASANTLPSGIEVGKVCIVGTHKPSVEVLSMVPEEKFSVLAVGHISLINTMGTALGGCVPEDVRLVLFDQPYILSGLRNGMLLRFEWPMNAATSTCFLSSAISEKSSLEALETVSASSGGENITWRMPEFAHTKSEGKMTSAFSFPTQLHLIAVRRVGVSPVSLVPLQASLRSDVIALGDRPWLLQTARHSQRIACTSISFQPSTHATPVRSRECLKGILFVADNSLHLVEMEHSKRLNVQRLSLGSTPRRIAYHMESKTLLVMRSERCDLVHGYVSDISCIDPVSGALLSSYKFDHTEVPKCMQLCKIGNEHLLLVGTGLTTGKAMLANGDPEGAKGRLLVFLLLPKHGAGNPDSMPVDENDIDLESLGCLTFAESEGLKIILRSHVQLSGVVLAVAPYLDRYILACAGNNLSCLGFSPDALHRLKRYDSVKTRFVITCLAVHLNRIAVGDCRDGIMIYSYQEYESKLEQFYCDPAQRLVADCALVDLTTALVTDRNGNFSVLTCPQLSEENSNPERNLVPRCWYHMGEVMMRICKGSLAYKVLMEDSIKTCNTNSTREFQESSVVASTMLGSVVIFVRLTREEYELLDAVQSRLALYPFTAPVLGNNHALFRGRGCPDGVYKVLDGDMLGQFLELTSSQQQSVLGHQPGLESLSSLNSTLQVPSRGGLSVEKVLRLLELVHNSLT